MKKPLQSSESHRRIVIDIRGIMVLTLLSALLACIPAVHGLGLPDLERNPSTLREIPSEDSLLLMQASVSDCFDSEQTEERSLESPLTLCQDLRSSCAAQNHPVRTSFSSNLLIMTDVSVSRNFAVLRIQHVIEPLISLRICSAVSFPARLMYTLHVLRTRSAVLCRSVAVVARSAYTVTETCV